MSFIQFLKTSKNKKIIIKAWCYCLWYRILIFLIPMKRLERSFGVLNEESPELAERKEYWYAVRVGHEVNRIADKTLWESKCLVRALAAQRILQEYEVHTTLYLGVGKDENENMIAHAWLRCGQCYVTGGNGSEYAVVAKFRK